MKKERINQISYVYRLEGNKCYTYALLCFSKVEVFLGTQLQEKRYLCCV